MLSLAWSCPHTQVPAPIRGWRSPWRTPARVGSAPSSGHRTGERWGCGTGVVHCGPPACPRASGTLQPRAVVCAGGMLCQGATRTPPPAPTAPRSAGTRLPGRPLPCPGVQPQGLRPTDS